MGRKLDETMEDRCSLRTESEIGLTEFPPVFIFVNLRVLCRHKAVDSVDIEL